MSGEDASGTPARLRRSLTLPLLVLYGVGVTVGAGIYVLMGTVISVAGALAPLSFIASAVLAGLTALCFAELSVRMPRAAGEALYVRNAMGSAGLALTVGLTVVFSGTVSSAAIVQGFAGYARVLVDVPDYVLIVSVTALLCLIAVWGIREAVTVASVFTILEVGGLLLVIWVARDAFGNVLPWVGHITDSFEPQQVLLIGSGAVLAFFAFIGFEDMVNVAEETRDVERTMPRAIVATLAITTALYIAVSLVGLLSRSSAGIADSAAPLADIYAAATGGSSLPVVVIGILAIVNGALIQIIMGARVLYGLAEQGDLPAVLGAVHPRMQTPVRATLLVGFVICIGALALPLEPLARLASVAILIVFALVNTSLVIVKRRWREAPPPAFRVPVWVPVLGAVTCAALVAFQIASFAGLLSV